MESASSQTSPAGPTSKDGHKIVTRKDTFPGVVPGVPSVTWMVSKIGLRSVRMYCLASPGLRFVGSSEGEENEASARRRKAGLDETEVEEVAPEEGDG